ncbi:Hsp20/alpha crystallin family protein [Roseateles violae]|uniref:Hsp20/alpha crystallin family protein n=1 Tax=Roseateles violae TaxID=3058042 RepID=A0ABT8DTN7_9BURK|nr:Hsp20/alpha crystallin family protein [Pelomonas sp. PFR6]MDN3921650.1 Hsp20/alpha crystallin family protein [Pelomonas sp. PFR6]
MFVFPLAHPVRRSAELSRRIERLFDINDDAVALRSPALDVSETDAAYTLQLDLPGVAKEAVKVKIEGRKISIDAEQARAAEQTEGERALYRERSVTRFSRSLVLPQEVSKNDSAAKLENGVLTLTLVKRVPDNAGELTIN